jgi:hypothetical protein
MSDEIDWNFTDGDDAKTEIRAAVEYLLREATGTARASITGVGDLDQFTGSDFRVGERSVSGELHSTLKAFHRTKS